VAVAEQSGERDLAQGLRDLIVLWEPEAEAQPEDRRDRARLDFYEVVTGRLQIAADSVTKSGNRVP
jgi:hypothetical protein